MCPYQRKLILIMTTLERYSVRHLNTELLILQLKIFKRKYNLTYNKLADKLGVHELQLSGWIRGKREPNYKNHVKLMNFLENHS